MNSTHKVEEQNKKSPDWAETHGLSDSEQSFLVRATDCSKQAFDAYSKHLPVLPADDPAWPLAFLTVGSSVVASCCRVLNSGFAYPTKEVVKHYLSDCIPGVLGENILGTMSLVAEDPQGRAGWQQQSRQDRRLLLEARGRAELVLEACRGRIDLADDEPLDIASMLLDIGHEVLVEAIQALTGDPSRGQRTTIIVRLQEEFWGRLGDFVVDRLGLGWAEPADAGEDTDKEAQLQHAE